MHRPVVSPQTTQQAGRDGVVSQLLTGNHFIPLYFMLFLIYHKMIEDELYEDCGNSLYNI